MRWTINFALLAEKKKTGIYSRRRRNEKTMRFLLDNFFLFSIFVIFLFYCFPWRTRSTYPDRIPVISKHLVSVIIRLVERFLLRVHTHTHTHLLCIAQRETQNSVKCDVHQRRSFQEGDVQKRKANNSSNFWSLAI
jgi:hypothetical protein